MPGMKVLTLDSCLQCNQSMSRSENLVFLILALVSTHPLLMEHRAPGGKVDRAFAQDRSLAIAVERCRNRHGNFELSGEALKAFDLVVRKTAQGLFYGLYAKVEPIEKFGLLSIEHTAYCAISDVVTRYRRDSVRDITDDAVPSISSGGAQNIYVMELAYENVLTGRTNIASRAAIYASPQKPIDWVEYQAGTLRFAFFQGQDDGAVCLIDMWDTLICAVRTPWPSQRGVLRRGRKNPNAR